jgi:hypothetical protein
MTSLSNRQTLPIRIDGILPSLDNLHMVIWSNLKYSANSLVVMISAKIESPGGAEGTLVQEHYQ